MHKKTPKSSNVVLSYKPGDTFEVKQACTLGHHKVKAGSTLQIQFYKRGSDQLSLDHIDKSEGLTFFTVSVADFIDAQKCLKKLNSSLSKAKQEVIVYLDPKTDADALKKMRAYWKEKGTATLSIVKGECLIKPVKSLTQARKDDFNKRFYPFFIKEFGKNVVKAGSYVIVNYYKVARKQNRSDQIETQQPEQAKLASKIGVHSKDLHNKLNAKSKPLAKVFGYWRPHPTKQLAGLPFPVAVDVAGYDAKAFMKELEVFLRECKILTNKGSSPNRWTGGANGASEYVHPETGWRMPSGAKYYLTRGVPPTQEFYKAVTGRTNSKLPSAKNYVIK